MNEKEVQEALKELGYDPGPIDGDIGPRTKATVRLFQFDKGLEVDGYPGPITRAALIAAQQGHRLTNAEKLFSITQPRATRPITEIIIHCTATPEGRSVSVYTIRAWHKAQGWKDIGYHWVVGLDGVPRPGRPEAQIGSHVAGHNTGTLGVVYVGGVAADAKTPKDTRTEAQREGLMLICKTLLQRYPKITKITGHNQYAAKACPSFNVQSDELGKLVR